MRQVSFQTGSAYRVEYGKKRVGKPRQNWIHQTKKHVYINKFNMFSYDESKSQDDQIMKYATERKFWTLQVAPTLSFLSDRGSVESEALEKKSAFNL